jgi:hypothetical protein
MVGGIEYVVDGDGRAFQRESARDPRKSERCDGG